MNKIKWKQTALSIAFAFAIAVIINMVVLKLFGQKSADRAEHSLVGIILLMVYTSLVIETRDYQFGPIRFFLTALIPCYFGTIFPDLDITLFGIGGHRNPIFHSSLSYFILLFAVGRKTVFFQTLVIGYGIGLSSHLLWDVFYYGDVRWLPGGTIDRAWLSIHGLISLIPPSSKGETVKDS